METNLSVRDIQLSIIDFFKWYERNKYVLWVPNLSSGYFDTHEADLVAIDRNHYLYEFEIKRSYSDFLADFRKSTTHFENKVFKLYYVVPESIIDKCADFLSVNRFSKPYDQVYDEDIKNPCGLISYSEDKKIKVLWWADNLNKYTKTNKKSYKLQLEEEFNIARLGCYRIWK